MNPEPICSIDNCWSVAVSRGWCSKHYFRWRNHGDPQYQRPIRYCSVDGCPSKASIRGWCIKHYNRWRDHGDVLLVPKPTAPLTRRPRRSCTVDDCDNFRRSNGYCIKHYARWKKYGDPLHLVKPAPFAPCSVDGCERVVRSDGFCIMHFGRWKVHGDPHRGRAPAIERFTAFWTPSSDSDCWLWTGERDKEGYGRFWFERKLWSVHRWSYEYHVGPIPEGLEIDHLCSVPRCVNPKHLEPVTHEENLRRTQERARARRAA